MHRHSIFLRPRLMAAVIGVWLAILSPAARGADASVGTTAPGRTNTFKLPSHLDSHWFHLQARIGDQGPFNLVMDTGASVLTLSPQVAERLRNAGLLHAAGSGRMETASGRHPKIPMAHVRDVRLGDFVVDEALAAVLDLGIIAKLAGEPVDGFAGMELFETGTLVLDFPRREARFEQGETPVTDHTVVLPCDFDGYRPTVGLKAGKEFRALIDSGFTSDFTVPGKGVKFAFVSDPVVISLAANATDVSEDKAARLKSDILWGGVTFERPIVRLGRTGTGMIGRKVLEHFTVGLDQPRQRILLTPATNAPVVARPFRSLGLALMPEERGLKVMATIPNTEAARSGIRRGQYVSAINGTPAMEWNLKRLRDLADEADTFEVEMLSPGKPRRLKLKVATLIP